ncbi:signal peptide peptidase SppA [Mobilicoccus pelagius]|uniref:Putative signal peptide peptidase n=1 Tax=Mobilicoccus pelagius NBRC 104925 TaxID=1089455 RepID=H5UP98_9MICO|nr:signal peptide peptidase SppA [Mobilicoccus pelagius]GAB47556.1 putative signal peptide peptidase [Mobilicoccus pelagius NBRC 104925]
MSGFSDLLDRLPFDTRGLRKLPVPGISGSCLLELDLARGIGETSPTSPVEALRERHTPTLHAVVEGLRDATGDDKVLGLIVHAYAPALAPAHAEEVRAAVEGFSDSGKPVVAWAETYGEMTNGVAGYLVATAADEIWLQPSGYLQINGAAVQAVFLREALDKIDVEPQFDKRREYKSAVETFTQRDISEPNREMLTSLTESALEVLLTGIARGRGLDVDDVRAVLDEGALTPVRAGELRLVDRIGYRDEAYTALRTRVGAEPDVELRYVERYDLGFSAVEAVRGRGRKTVAIVQANGAIHLGRSGNAPLGGRSIGSDSLGAALRQVADDDKIGAVVLRVDSPGGSAVASDAIRREILRLREEKPVVASMGTVAGSGGYFISMPATEIVADGTTLTGSIGVYAGKFVTQGGLDRLGIHRTQIERGRYAGMLSDQRPFTEDEWALLSRMLDEIYADFTTKAAEDRGMPVEQLEPLARGRVWTGAQAADLGLVDHVGGMRAAIDRACALADLDPETTPTRISPKLGVLDRFLPADNSDAVTRTTTGLGGAAVRGTVTAALGEGVPLLDQALAALGARGAGVLTMTPTRWT